MKTKKMIKLLLTLAAVPILAQAQSAGVGGGSFTEAEMKGFMSILSDYFATKDYSVLFPEVVQWEKQRNTRMANFIKGIEPRVVDHPIYFPAEVERDCVSYAEDVPPIRWFECNSARIPESKLENQPKLYALLAHEIFVLAGIEKAGDANVPSTYQSSSKFLNRTNLSLATLHRYVPGRQNTQSSSSSIPQILKDIRQEFRKPGKPVLSKFKFNRCVAVKNYPKDLSEPISDQQYLWESSLFDTPVEFFSISDNTVYYTVKDSEGNQFDARNLVQQPQGIYEDNDDPHQVGAYVDAKLIQDDTLILENGFYFDPNKPNRGIPSVHRKGRVAMLYVYCKRH